ncbi:armadillo-type protein [Thamnocephalis sphaerospora]|uniref:Eukaryotic translation initiation factor 3 subunit K n=1 Tax=Thamnocephalis sphaerospora TaxID=78915 RepID=A0A4V1IX98_9FUNG|nr:armadillo-type protein [Thamnocephalis sphaerospora]|eukprot:RKP10309.1 armadillo-type protein [Thamnocephalis sphaerospora]
MSAPTIARPEAINTIVNGIDRYNPANIALLEEYLAEQCRQSGSDLQVNLALLKLYQFNDEAVKLDVIATVLAKALVMSPEPDFNLCLYLLNGQIIADEKIACLIALQQLVEEARFVEFWAALEANEVSREAVSGMPDFDTAMRKLIAGVVTAVYQTVSVSVLEKQLNLKGKDLDQFIAAQGWAVQDGVVSIPLNEENEAKSSVTTEALELNQMTKILAHANAH